MEKSHIKERKFSFYFFYKMGITISHILGDLVNSL
jgi:hypothetical protein